ncbi:hypothetical protein MHTCC0001_10440 [Flavobacteriaceae bacterium MHTCC 0001]
MLKSLSYICFALCCAFAYAQPSDFKQQLDSIHKLRKLTEDETLDLETRIDYAKRASALSVETGVDSVILRSDRYLAWIYLDDQKYTKLYKHLSHRNIKSARKLRDSLGLAYSYSNLGYFFARYTTQNDSAYFYFYNALRIHEGLLSKKKIKDILHESEILGCIAYLQTGDLDFISAQNTTIKAINLLQTLPDNEKKLDELWSLYNFLGLSLKGHKSYDEALKYYSKGLKISEKLDDNFEAHLYLKINMAEVYKEKRDYNEVLNTLNELLDKYKNLENKDSNLYAIIINNMAYTYFLSNSKNYKKIDTLFSKAYSIFEELKLPKELSSGGNDMAEYYYARGNKTKALKLTKRSCKLAKSIREYKEVFRALKMLSKLKPGDSGKAYLNEYIRLSDSLITKERQNRNKYARIQYETDLHIKEAERLSTQNLLIGIIAVILVLCTVLLYFVRRQQTKHKLLAYEQEQQQASQQIYELMIDQQNKLEEGRLKERHRISEEVHDGILSHLFGARLGLAFLPIEGDDTTKQQFKALLGELQEVERDMRDISHKLKQDETIPATNYDTLVKDYVATQAKLGGFTYTINNSVDWHSIPNTVKVALFRILQESMKNIITHAKAKAITITLKMKANTLDVQIADDGIGFDTSTGKKGIGLQNIASRVAHLKGELTITSQKGIGTQIQFSIPIKQ